MKFDNEYLSIHQETTIKLQVVNGWLEKNIKHMKKNTIHEPINWVEGGGGDWFEDAEDNQ